MEEDNQQFYEGINPLLKGIYEDACKEDTSHMLSFLADVEGRYCENNLCGEGGMKKVFAADDNFSGRQVAMARLKDLENGDSFLREVKLLARLEHPNIVPLYDIGMDECQEPYIIMKLLGGCRFSDMLASMAEGTQPYDLAYLLEIFLKICDATAYAHSKQIIHADIKPENIQIDDYGSVLLCDWGLAFDLNNEIVLKRRQSKGKAEGTPGSMAPEQLSEEFGALSEKTDIYSLGCLLYCLLTLKPPLAGESLEEVVDKTITGDIQTAAALSGKSVVPKALSAVAARAMALRPEDRYESVRELTEDIRSYLSGFATQAENAGFLKELSLFVKRNQRSCSIAFISLIIIVIIVSAFWGAVEDRESLANAAFKEAEMQKNVNVSISRIAEQELLDKANADFKRLNIWGAKKHCEEVLTLNISSKPAHYLLGRVYFALSRFSEAQKHFRKIDDKENFYKKLNEKVLNKELNDEKLLRTLVERYDDLEVTTLLPKIYAKHKGQKKVDILDMLMRFYRSGGPPLNEQNYKYYLLEDKLVLKNLRLRKLCFISGLGLKNLVLEKCVINDSRVLNVVSLENLSLARSSVKGIDDLKTKVSGKLDVSGTNLLSPSFLANQEATVLDVSSTQLNWFAKLQEAKNLKKVILSSWCLKSSSVKNLKGIEVIDKQSIKASN
ncbi:MAG: serine/threonine protein kinase [Lentisphaerales bacterium]|nr:serine/threonine protein kinase [Lentisphaerales bacterium]